MIENNNKQYCMDFTNDEIYDYLIRKFQNFTNVDIRILSDEKEIDISTTKLPIEFICFDGNQEDFFISFLGHQTSIFIQNHEIMFIDDSVKNNYTTSDTYGNIVYEGELWNLSKKEILNILSEVAKCFIGSVEIQMSEGNDTYSENNKIHPYYRAKTYEINIINNNSCKKTKIFENLTITY